jgi:hypothetical protein
MVLKTHGISLEVNYTIEHLVPARSSTTGHCCYLTAAVLSIPGGLTVMYRLTLVIFFKIYGERVYLDRDHLEEGLHIFRLYRFKLEFAPLVSYQFNFSEAHGDRVFFKTCHEHPDETNGFKIGNVSHFTFKFRHRNAKQVPVLVPCITISKFNIDVSYVL